MFIYVNQTLETDIKISHSDYDKKFLEFALYKHSQSKTGFPKLICKIVPFSEI